MHLTRWGRSRRSPSLPRFLLMVGSMPAKRISSWWMHCGATDPWWRSIGGIWTQRVAEEGYWFPDYLGDLDALLDLLSPHAPVRLVGHSMGAQHAARTPAFGRTECVA